MSHNRQNESQCGQPVRNQCLHNVGLPSSPMASIDTLLDKARIASSILLEYPRERLQLVSGDVTVLDGKLWWGGAESR